MLPPISDVLCNRLFLFCHFSKTDHAQVGSIPEIQAKHVDAAIIHEAAIGRINDEQLLKLRTLGMTEAEAENVIIENFLS